MSPRDTFDEKYLDVLQNIEFALMSIYRAHSEMTDWDALDAVQAMIRSFTAETRKQPTPAFRLRPIAQEAYDAVKGVCEWRLGRAPAELTGEQGQPIDMPMTAKTFDEIIACLKRIRRSIQMWQKEGGRRGYFNFVSQFVK